MSRQMVILLVTFFLPQTLCSKVLEHVFFLSGHKPTEWEGRSSLFACFVLIGSQITLMAELTD